MRGVRRSSILERRAEILQLIITAILIAVSVEILSDVITGQIQPVFATLLAHHL